MNLVSDAAVTGPLERRRAVHRNLEYKGEAMIACGQVGRIGRALPEERAAIRIDHFCGVRHTMRFSFSASEIIKFSIYEKWQE